MEREQTRRKATRPRKRKRSRTPGQKGTFQSKGLEKHTKIKTRQDLRKHFPKKRYNAVIDSSLVFQQSKHNKKHIFLEKSEASHGDVVETITTSDVNVTPEHQRVDESTVTDKGPNNSAFPTQPHEGFKQQSTKTKRFHSSLKSLISTLSNEPHEHNESEHTPHPMSNASTNHAEKSIFRESRFTNELSITGDNSNHQPLSNVSSGDVNLTNESQNEPGTSYQASARSKSCSIRKNRTKMFVSSENNNTRPKTQSSTWPKKLPIRKPSKTIPSLKQNRNSNETKPNVQHVQPSLSHQSNLIREPCFDRQLIFDWSLPVSKENSLLKPPITPLLSTDYGLSITEQKPAGLRECDSPNNKQEPPISLSREYDSSTIGRELASSLSEQCDLPVNGEEASMLPPSQCSLLSNAAEPAYLVLEHCITSTIESPNNESTPANSFSGQCNSLLNILDSGSSVRCGQENTVLEPATLDTGQCGSSANELQSTSLIPGHCYSPDSVSENDSVIARYTIPPFSSQYVSTIDESATNWTLAQPPIGSRANSGSPRSFSTIELAFRFIFEKFKKLPKKKKRGLLIAAVIWSCVFHAGLAVGLASIEIKQRTCEEVWSEWGQCDVTCGVGNRTREGVCDERPGCTCREDKRRQEEQEQCNSDVLPENVSSVALLLIVDISYSIEDENDAVNELLFGIIDGIFSEENVTLGLIQFHANHHHYHWDISYEEFENALNDHYNEDSSNPCEEFRLARKLFKDHSNTSVQNITIYISDGENACTEFYNAIQKLESLARILLVGSEHADWNVLQEFNCNGNDRFQIHNATNEIVDIVLSYF